MTYPDAPVGSLLAGAASRYRDRIAFRHADEELSFSQLWSSACRFGNALRERGVGPGDTVALHLPNCLAFPIAYYGTLLAGATFSPANPLLPPKALAEQLADDPLVPRWVLWTGGAVLLVLLAVVGLAVLRRRSADPYGLGRRTPETERRPVRGRRRRGRGRRGVSR